MKKYLSLFLVAIVVLVILVSCGASQDAISSSDGTKDSINGVGGSDLTDVSSNKGGATVGSTDTSKEETTESEADAPKDDTTDSVTDTSKDETTVGSSDTSMGDTTDSSSEPPKEDDPQNPKDPTEKVHTVTWQLNYDYGDWIITPDPSYVPSANLLFDYGNLGRGFDGVIRPDDIVAGDTITIEYTGEITILESYPARIQLDGEVKSYSFGYAEVTYYEGEDFSIEHIKACYDYKDAYVILDRSGKYVKLDEYTGNEIYLVTDQKKLYGDDLGGIQDVKAPLKYPIACMLAYNPRDLEDGVPTATPPADPTEKVHTVTWQFGYSYSHVFDSITGEPFATLLVNYGNLGKGFDGVVIPNDIVAGDTITIEYTGNISIEEIYPSRIQLTDGEVKFYSFSRGNIIFEGKRGTPEEIKAKYDLDSDYVIVDREGRFVSLDEYNGKDLYLVEKQGNGDMPKKIACMLAYNPRDVEGTSDTISVEQAIEIAQDHFYLNYAEDGDGFEYIVKLPNLTKDYWEICFRKEYVSGELEKRAYYYAIDKFTGEIISMAIDE